MEQMSFLTFSSCRLYLNLEVLTKNLEKRLFFPSIVDASFSSVLKVSKSFFQIGSAIIFYLKNVCKKVFSHFPFLQEGRKRGKMIKHGFFAS